MGNDVVIVSAVRTAVGKFGGALKNESPQSLAALVIAEAVGRAGVDPAQVETVIMGWTRQTTEASNIARVSGLKAGLPVEISAYSVHRQCISGLHAIVEGYREIATGAAEIVVAGGTEVLSGAPYYLKMARFGYYRGDGLLVDSLTEAGPGGVPPELYGKNLSMGITAENLAEKYGIPREEQDRFAYRSQMKTADALKAKRFKEETVPVPVRAGKETILFDTDEFPRPDTTLEQLAKLRPAFKENGTVTAGNSSGQNDGASAVVLMHEKKAEKLNLTPLARVVAEAGVGVDPRIMGISPVPATRIALKRAELSLDDIDQVEMNEAFAVQCLAVLKEMPIAEEKLNVNGGAVALGHPVGATGAILMTKLLYEMKRRRDRFGLVTLCGAGGQGMSVIVERLE